VNKHKDGSKEREFPSFYVEFHKRFRAAFELAKKYESMTQDKLEPVLGIGQTAISNFYQGKSMPNAEVLAKAEAWMQAVETRLMTDVREEGRDFMARREWGPVPLRGEGAGSAPAGLCRICGDARFDLTELDQHIVQIVRRTMLGR
jgi:transcriptional regulator with XRE-family HTH domain